MKPRAGFLKGETKLGLPWRLSGKESACNAEDVGLIPGQEDSPREENGNPLQYSCMGDNPMDKGACWVTVYNVAKRFITT